MTKPNRRWKGWRNHDAPSEVTVSHILPQPLAPGAQAKAARFRARYLFGFNKRRNQGIDRKPPE